MLKLGRIKILVFFRVPDPSYSWRPDPVYCRIRVYFEGRIRFRFYLVGQIRVFFSRLNQDPVFSWWPDPDLVSFLQGRILVATRILNPVFHHDRDPRLWLLISHNFLIPYKISLCIQEFESVRCLRCYE